MWIKVKVVDVDVVKADDLYGTHTTKLASAVRVSWPWGGGGEPGCGAS